MLGPVLEVKSYVVVIWLLVSGVVSMRKAMYHWKNMNLCYQHKCLIHVSFFKDIFLIKLVIIHMILNHIQTIERKVQISIVFGIFHCHIWDAHSPHFCYMTHPICDHLKISKVCVGDPYMMVWDKSSCWVVRAWKPKMDLLREKQKEVRHDSQTTT